MRKNRKRKLVDNQKPKAKVYIDASNIFFTQKKLGWLIDWKKFKRYLTEKFDILSLRYYTVYIPKDKSQEKFFDFLEKELGFVLIKKPLKKIKAYFFDKEGKATEKIIFKGNVDVEIVRDSLLDREKYQYLILLSGDSDLAVLKKDWQARGRKLVVFSSRKTLSWELKLVSDKIYYLEDLKAKIYRKNWGLTEEKKYGKSKTSNRTR